MRAAWIVLIMLLPLQAAAIDTDYELVSGAIWTPDLGR
jgi:hypothetical protein